MARSTTVLLAALLVAPACDDSAKKPVDADESQAAKTSAKTSAAPAAEPRAPEAPTPEQAANDEAAAKWAEKLASRKLAASGLDVGSRLSAFDIINCESGDEYCQVCKYGGSPKIMAVGTPEDEAFKEDLRNLDAIVKKYGEDKVKAFAVITDIENGKAVTPADAEAAQKKADALRAELAVSMPIVIPAPKDGGPNKIWDEYYNITKSRTVMFADGRNEVKFSAVGPEDWSELNAAIVEVVGG